MACISEVQANGKIKNALLFSTDIHLPPEQIVEYYQARFQIEFIFRDAKQFTGLSDCQARHLPRRYFHFNASLIALNLAKD
ncbi:transposase [Microcoleus sp. OTE_8_concoct_300]|uniref:transposase n=1 Tax=Microcoleus sp. OTE_8_concoct_300 TaxID=2964710 RepID=UPI00403F5EFC